MIDVVEPRYHDRVVLLARYKLPCGRDVKVRILRGAYAGVYFLTNDAICKAPIETIMTRSGRAIAMRAVPLDALERVEDE